MWAAFLVWKDLGTARDDRRRVPLDPAARASSPEVSIIHQVCNVLHRNPPHAAEWKATLLAKALHILNRHTAADIRHLMRWFVVNRDSQEIPPRLDFILDAFDSFLDRARREVA